jgi:hypothetical protein
LAVEDYRRRWFQMSKETPFRLLDRALPVGSDESVTYEPTDEEWMRWEEWEWQSEVGPGLTYDWEGFSRPAPPWWDPSDDHELLPDSPVQWAAPGWWVVSGCDVLPVLGWVMGSGGSATYLPVTPRGVFAREGGEVVLTHEGAVAEVKSRRKVARESVESAQSDISQSRSEAKQRLVSAQTA